MKPLLLPTPAQRADAIAGMTQFRIVVKPQPESTRARGHKVIKVADYFTGRPREGLAYYWKRYDCWNSSEPFTAPHAAGDILYHAEPYQVIRGETSRHVVLVKYIDSLLFTRCELSEPDFLRWSYRKKLYAPSPACWMYPSLARYFYEVVDARCELLQDITHEDAISEGVVKLPYNDYGTGSAYKDKFAEQWNSTHKKPYLWDDNIWVWKITFKKVEVD